MLESIKTKYTLEQEVDLNDISGKGLLFRHKKTGARVSVVSNNDENKVFLIGFRTPPKDDTGVAHIIEHTVLCGSDNFPVKDPFMELVKGSLNTFLNAITYPDKTIYPVASCNDKDFHNLMHVYMDAVFNPRIYKNKEFFLQEGWRYELESPEDELNVNGVVYSEMKGAYSSPERVLNCKINETLFKDHPYGRDSGGDPDHITDLTYEDYLDFHKRYYHPTNSYIYLYGNMDIAERLEWLDSEYLSKYDYQPVNSVIEKQKPFGEVVEKTYSYSVNESETTDKKTYLSYNCVFGDATNVELCEAFDIITRVLFNSQGAPIKQALIDAGIGEDITADFDDSIMQPVLSIIAKNTDLSKKDAFVKCIRDGLREQVEKGINKTSLKAAISAREFSYKEADYGRYPKGLMYGVDILSTWLHDDTQVFPTLMMSGIFKKMYENAETGYFEELIEKYLLEPNHGALVVLSPEPGLVAKKEQKLKDKLKEMKANMSAAEIDELVAQTKNLEIFQETPDSKEALATIPKLLIEDIDKKAPEVCNIEKSIKGIPAIMHDYETNGISYIRLLFRLGDINDELLPYAGLLTRLLGNVNAGELSYLELSNEINIHTGGIGTDTTYYGVYGQPDEFMPYYVVSSKVMFKNTDKALSLMAKIISESDLEDEKRIKEIINETKARMQMTMSNNGDGVAVKRAASYISHSGYFQEATNGVEFYRFLEDLSNNFDAKAQQIKASLKKLMKLIFRKGNMIISVTTNNEGFAKLDSKFDIIYDILSDEQSGNCKTPKYELSIKNEGLTTPGQVQYVAKCGNYLKAGFEYTGSLKVLRTILGLDYLWNKIRVKGGAYGCSCNFTGIDGLVYFSSYRDPNLKETFDVIDDAYVYVKDFSPEQDEMNNYVIGTIGALDTPLTPAMKGNRSFSSYMTKTPFDAIQKERDEILATDVDTIRSLSELTKVITESDALCVVGYENKILENKELFKETRALY